MPMPIWIVSAALEDGSVDMPCSIMQNVQLARCSTITQFDNKPQTGNVPATRSTSAEGAAEDGTGVAFQCDDLLAGGRVPNPCRLVPRGRGNEGPLP